MTLMIIREDITRMKVDAIVNAANTELQRGGGVCGAIFKAAGAQELQAACNLLAPIATGEAVITPGFALPAKYIIHTAGPIYNHWPPEESRRHLECSYSNSLKLAIQNGCESIAFPLISSGIYGYPKAEALKVATSAIQSFLAGSDIEVFLVVFDKMAFAISEELLGEVASYIDEHYVKEHLVRRRGQRVRELNLESSNHNLLEDSQRSYHGIEELVGNLDEPFSETLLRLIDAKGMSDVEVYKSANLDRKLFSKIRSAKGYTPSKRTALALAIALRLDHAETADLLARAGYALSPSQKFDVIIEYFISHSKYDIYEINEVLFSYDQPLLGG